MNVIQEIFSQFTKMQLTDYLDIALVAFLIYKLLPLIRTPSTKRIAGAVVGILVVVWVADIANLYTISWILSQFLSVGLLAVVVLSRIYTGVYREEKDRQKREEQNDANA